MSCRVRACSAPVPSDHCAEHNTPEVRAMVRPHVYVYQGRRVVLESTPWDADEPPAEKPSAPPVARNDARQPAPAARPCWAWCGRGGPGPGCHPGSVFPAPPTIPCLACGRAFFACDHPGACCSDECSEFLRALRSRPPAEIVARWLSAAELEAWEERAAVLGEAVGLAPTVADRRALVMVWSARERGTVPRLEVALDHARTEPRAAAVSAAPIAHESAARTHAAERTADGQFQLLLFGG